MDTNAVEDGHGVGDVLERLCVILLGLDDEQRDRAARYLSTLALAPDSGRTLESLKAELAKTR